MSENIRVCIRYSLISELLRSIHNYFIIFLIRIRAISFDKTGIVVISSFSDAPTLSDDLL